MKPLPIAFAGAFALHAAAAVSIAALGVPHGTGQRPAVEGTTIDVEAEPVTPAPRELPTPVASKSVSSPGTARAQPLQAAPHLASAAPVETATSGATSDTVPAPVPSAAPTHFKMTVASEPSVSDGHASAAPAAPEVVADADVTTRAHQVGGTEPTYPPEAVAQGVELSAPLPFEIVVDASGRVTSAQPLRRAGYGFDEAALAALRTFRFAPAMRGGRAVGVRMRWTVDFRLQ